MKKLCVSALILLAFAACQKPTKEAPAMETKDAKNIAVETIMNRRSIRAYKPEQIKAEQLDTILKCAINAPSAMNRQPWEIRVVQKPELLKAINNGFIKFAADTKMGGNASKSQDTNFSVFYNAPTLILIATEAEKPFAQVDCGLMGQNITLAAESMNIGSCIIGSVAMYLNTPDGIKAIESQLNLPKGFHVLYTIALGYKNETPDAKPRDENKIQIIK